MPDTVLSFRGQEEQVPGPRRRLGPAGSHAMFWFYSQSTFPGRRRAILPFNRTLSWSLNRAQPKQAAGSRAASADACGGALRPENQLTGLEQMRKMKARAPPPPGKPTTPNMHSGQKLPRDVSPSPTQNLLHMKETLRNSMVAVTVVLPSGLEKKSVVNGSHAMMDLLVELCLQNHLNPSHHALEIWSSETQQPLSFKPNTLVGTLNVHTVFLKEKVPEEKVKPAPPKAPEKSVRLVVNYLRTQKAIVRVSPEVPLRNILPVICAKCEVSPEHVVLLRDNIAGEEVELSKSLSELGIKELYAWDNKRETFRKSSLGNDETDKEKKKFLGFFKVNKRSSSKGCLTTPNSPSVNSRSITLGPSLSLSNISGVSVKSDLKKRRAPPPPALPGTGPPAEGKTSEKVSLGSQIDLQKKKRRAPAPPTPQPPTPSPLVPPRMQDREENRKSTVVSLPLGPSSPCGTDRVPPVLWEAEETVSVSSCFVSEDTTEDSGVVSSPSDIISLDSQHDSMKSKDKWATDQEDGSDQDLAGTPELGPHKSPTWERNSSGNWHPRPEATITSSGDEDLFLTGQFRKTLEELDEELEELEESPEACSSLPTGSVNGASPHCMPEATVPECDEDTIPVTFIGEVSDDPVDSGLSSNRNSNAGSFDLGGIAGKGAPPTPRQEENNQQHGRRTEGPNAPAPPHDIGEERKPASSDPCEAVNLNKMEPKVTSAAFHTHGPDARLSGEEPGSALGGKTQASKMARSQPVRDKEGEGNSGSAPPSWYQRGQNPGGRFGLKYGLTTYKIVPPKSEMRCYDRGVSLSTGAIKIDELGNLVSPHANGGKTIALSPSALDLETQPIGKVKEFWRSNSLEKHSGQPTEGSTRTPTPATPAKPQPQENRLRAEPTFPDPKVTSPPQQSAHQEEGRHLEEGRSRPPTAAPCHIKVPAGNATEVPFLKPQRRTSSQYVASAIAKRIGPQKAHTGMGRKQGHAEETREGDAPELAGQPPARRDGTAPSPYSDTRSRTDGEGSAVGAQPRAQVSSPPGKLSAQDCPVGVHRSPHVPPVTASQRDHVTQSWSLSGKQSTSNPRTSSASAPTCTLDGTNRPPARSGDDQTPGRTLVNGSRWGPIHTEPPQSRRGSSTNNHAGQEPLPQEEKPSLSCADVHETDGTLPPSIFGPKKKFRPVVQRPAPKDMSLHSALMEAIHSAGGKDRLRKIAADTSEGGPRKPSYTETVGERSALLSAIRGHSGACSLRKVSSFASEELRSFRVAEQSSEPPGLRDLGLQPLPAPPPPPPATQAPSTSRTAARSSSGNPAEARQALMDAIRSGTGAARLRKVPLLV
uniref:Protein cordon-bleu n=1 Tax=Callorhinus ursinus TaxID=34884 RepID=A0A3Q7MP67_CALUR|nr:protein cordon-bleu [Callorhinus ursinus]